MEIKEIALYILIPFLGTTLGSALVFLMKKKVNEKVQKTLLGFAAGIMLAASFWSLLNPSIESSASMGKLAFLPAMIGLILGFGFLLILDSLIPHLHLNTEVPEGLNTKKNKKTTMLIFAVTLHNIPEGLALGVALAGAYYGNSIMTSAAALTLAIGLAIQNAPEGAAISLPLEGAGLNKPKSFLWGVFSGAVEPISTILVFFLTQFFVTALPYMLAFAAGAMIYVCVEELIPESQAGEHTNWATIGLAIGFILMMVLDVALG